MTLLEIGIVSVLLHIIHGDLTEMLTLTMYFIKSKFFDTIREMFPIIKVCKQVNPRLIHGT